MTGDEKMNQTTNSRIGRRRGASKKKSPRISLIVSVVSFCATFLIILRVFFSSTAPAQTQDPIFENTYDFMKRKYRNNIDGPMGSANEWDSILRAEVHLVDISPGKLKPSSDGKGGYEGVKAKFCRLNWDLHKQDPPSYPMFRSLVSASGCDKKKNIISIDLNKSTMGKVRQYDEIMEETAQSGHVDDIDGYVHLMPPSGFVFHESRVGSTLVANSLAAMNPEGHRVFSESNPINNAIRACEQLGSGCDDEMNAELFRDVVYLMGRTKSPEEKHLFFKVSSIGTKKIAVMREALPTVPWIFVYRNPVQTMMSHLDPDMIGEKTKGISAVCTRARGHPPGDLQKLVAGAGRSIEDLNDIEFCAAHLASLCESALTELRKSSTGKAVEYEGLVDKLVSDVIPNHFGVEMDDASRQRILDVSKKYSKNKKGDSEWKEDSERKEDRATQVIKDASELFLSKSYSELNTYTKN